MNPEAQNDKIEHSSLKPGDESSEFCPTLLTFDLLDNSSLCLCGISPSDSKKLSPA